MASTNFIVATGITVGSTTIDAASGNITIGATTINGTSGEIVTTANITAAGGSVQPHPANHPPSIITQDSSNRFVTDAEKSTWSSTTSTVNSHVGAGGTSHANAVAAGAAGFMTGADKTKLDGITGTNTGDQTITLTGAVTGSGTGSFTASLGSFTLAQLNTAVSDANVQQALVSGTNIKTLNGISLLGSENIVVGSDLTGPISSTGGVTAITSQTGTGSKFVMDTAPTIVNAKVTGSLQFGSVGVDSVIELNGGTNSTGAALPITVKGQTPLGTTQAQGGQINLTGGKANAVTTGTAGGSVNITGGQGHAISGVNGAGGAATLYGGSGTSLASGGGGRGGHATVAGGAALAAGNGGDANISGGSAGTEGTGGVISIKAGTSVSSTAANINGPYVDLTGGTPANAGAGGAAYISGGPASTGVGGLVQITGGDGSSGFGGDIILKGGIGNGAGKAGGNVTLAGGLGNSGATAGILSLTNPVITNYVETVYAPGAGSAWTVDLANGTFQKFTTNANTTITLPSSIAGKSYVILVAYGGTHSITWAGGSTLKWAGGSAPTSTSVNGKFDIFAFTCDGTNTYARSGGSNF